MADPVWTAATPPIRLFTRGLQDARPAVHALPASSHALRAPGGLGVIAAGVVWIPVADRVLAVSDLGDGLVRAQGDRVVIESPARRLIVDATGWELGCGRRERAGKDLRLMRQAAGWVSPGLPLTDGAARARDTAPFTTGRGVVWSDSGWVYRQEAGGPPVPLGAINHGEAVRVGPRGAVLLCTPDGVERVAAPGRVVVPLEVPLDPTGPVRFSDDGMRVAGLDGGDVVVLDAADGALVVREPGGILLDPDRLLAPGDDETLAWMSSPTVWDQDFLGGPEGAIWSLADGRRTTASVLGPGPTAATRHGWATTDGRRRVRWLDPATGASRGGGLRIPDDTWSVARSDGEAAWFGTAAGRWLRVTHQGVVDTAHDAPPAPVAHTPDEAWASLGLEARITRGGRAWMWSAAGLLVSAG